jgi:serine/threonine protein kinase
MDAAEGPLRTPPGPPATAVPDTEPTAETHDDPSAALFSHHATDLGLAGSSRNRLPDETDLAAGESLGDVRIVRLLAEGGMGRVYEGLQTQPRRAVAVKVMRSTRLAPAAVERFHREIEVLARLVHPGIAQVHLAGTCRVGGLEIPYYVMEFVAGGRTILDHCEAAGLDCVGRLRLFAAVCEAIAHGHARGVVHRDIKPGNVLVDPEGRPKVIDFGIARVPEELAGGPVRVADLPADAGDPIDAVASHTQAGTLLGTRRYMSPEQFAADGRAVPAASDIWSLGVLLHELLSGTPPHDLEGLPLPVAARAVAELPPRPLVVRDRSLDRRARRRLAMIADRCLAADSPTDRSTSPRRWRRAGTCGSGRGSPAPASGPATA